MAQQAGLPVVGFVFHFSFLKEAILGVQLIADKYSLLTVKELFNMIERWETAASQNRHQQTTCREESPPIPVLLSTKRKKKSMEVNLSLPRKINSS